MKVFASAKEMSAEVREDETIYRSSYTIDVIKTTMCQPFERIM